MDAQVPAEIDRRRAASKLGIVVVDYGMGNLISVTNAFRRLGCTARVASDTASVLAADALVLPGVGAFGEAMRSLRERGLAEPLAEAVLSRSTPFLGICLGMQLLASRSDEHGEHEGLGWIDATVDYIPAEAGKVPHVGWTRVTSQGVEGLFDTIGEDAMYYFDHSLHFDPGETLETATFAYGSELVAAFRKDNIFATQFHPEKSDISGLRLLRNFLNACVDRQVNTAGAG